VLGRRSSDGEPAFPLSPYIKRLRGSPQVARLTDLPVALWDERLSTAAVERELIAADASRGKRKAVIDQHAAVFILQGALERGAARAHMSPAISPTRRNGETGRVGEIARKSRPSRAIRAGDFAHPARCDVMR
jgi:hypothetical protein